MIRLAILTAMLAATACADSGRETSPHPANLTGRWVRLKQDHTWGDTMEFMPDGAIHGSATYPVPSNLRWEIRYDSVAGPQYCALQIDAGFCRPYHLQGDTLRMIGGPQGDTQFRRVR